MLKNRAFTAFAFVGLLGLAACGGDAEETVIEEPVVEQPAPAIEPAPMGADTMGMGMDTTMADTAGGM